MAYGFAVTLADVADFSGRNFEVTASVAVTTGTYPTGGVGPLGLAALAALPVNSATPIKTDADSVGDPPSGIVYQYDPTTDSLRAMVTGAASGDALQEFSGTIPADTIQVTQRFTRN